MQDFIPRKKDINGEIEPITVKQYDNNSRFLHVKILDDDVDGKLFDLTDCTASLYIQPKDNTDPSEVAYIAGEASFDEENGGIATFLLPGSVTQNVGEYECEIHISEGDTENYPHISTKPFIMTVEKSIRNDSAIMASESFSALDEIIIRAETAIDELEDVADTIADIQRKQIDGEMYARPIFLSDIAGHAAQSMVVIGQSGGNDIYLIGFTNTNDETKTLLLAYNAGTHAILSSAEFSFGHANSMAVDGDGVIFLPNENGQSVYRLTITSYASSLTISQLDPVTAPTGWTIKDIFGLNGVIYANGTHNGDTYYWPLGDEGAAVKITLPDEQPRISQSWATDGDKLYILRSSPNAVAVYDFTSGSFIRWVNIGDFVGATFPIGEIEGLCFTESGAMLLSQLYYDLPAKARRFWMISDLKLSSEIVPEQQHIYPNVERTIYVSNALGGNLTFRTNAGDTYPSADDLTGSENHPYPSLDAALYASSATPHNNIRIVMLNTGTDYTIGNTAMNMQVADITIECRGNVTFQYLELDAGALAVTGNATFAKLFSAANTSLTISGCTFSATGRVSGRAPYILNGEVAIVNAAYTGGSSEILFEFASGTTGVVGFTSGTPAATNYQQTNLTLLNMKTEGSRERWATVFSGGTVTVGTSLTMADADAYVRDNTVYRVRWCASADSGYYNTTVHILGDTTVDLAAMVTASGSLVYRVAKAQFRPRVYDSRTSKWVYGNIKIVSVTDYAVSSGAISGTAVTSGSLPSGFAIESIELKGY